MEPLGLSRNAGSFTFYETINNRGFVSTSSSLEHTHAEMVGDEYIERTIQTITLDSFDQNVGDKHVSFMKIDVEGHEHAVIAGGRQFLAKHRPILTVELLGNAERTAIDDFIIEENYLAFAMAPGTLRQRERMMFFSDAWNHILVPAEKVRMVFAACRHLGLQMEL
ncbi:hypothetical protein FHS96_005787 [Sphingomonas zeicaulis]